MLESYHSIRVAISHVSSEHWNAAGLNWNMQWGLDTHRTSKNIVEKKNAKYFINNILVTVWWWMLTDLRW